MAQAGFRRLKPPMVAGVDRPFGWDCSTRTPVARPQGCYQRRAKCLKIASATLFRFLGAVPCASSVTGSNAMAWRARCVMRSTDFAASVQDRDGARQLLRHLPGHCKKLRKIWVDGGYSGRLVDWVAQRFRFVLTGVLRPKERRGFVLLPRRWVVERTFGWLNHSRRLSKDYERLMSSSEAWIYLAMSRLMANRLA